MIGRHWRGFAPHETAQAYLEHLRESTLPSLREIAGQRGATVLHRRVDDKVEFVVLTFWDSLDAVREFAGDDYEGAVVPPEARKLLASFDDRVAHYEVAIEPGPADP